ncbi:hypothetical protein P8452_70382 [Trifolium repens]|nr:hypothetical protein P8452_70382 [Trifolium repens]
MHPHLAIVVHVAAHPNPQLLASQRIGLVKEKTGKGKHLTPLSLLASRIRTHHTTPPPPLPSPSPGKNRPPPPPPCHLVRTQELLQISAVEFGESCCKVRSSCMGLTIYYNRNSKSQT